MIVIKASGRADVRTLRKLADELSAAPVEGLSAEAIETAINEDPQPRRRDRRPNADPRPAASVSPAAQAVIMQLARADEGIGRYEA